MGLSTEEAEKKLEKLKKENPMPTLRANAKNVKDVAGEKVKVAKQYGSDRKQLEQQRDEMKEKLEKNKERKTSLLKDALEEYEKTIQGINDNITLAERLAKEQLSEAEE